MRLINATTLKIEEFTGRKVPRYAILSHTWGNEELTFQDWIYTQGQSPPRWGWTQIPEEIERLKLKEGYVKVTKACEHARKHYSRCQWLWADTVCIDKTSSAELSEAINSMFEWYRRAEICLAFMVDVPPMSDEELSKCSRRTSAFRQSRWFCRGWTLQELVAPWSLEFLSNDWTSLGTKSALATHISAITSIPVNCLSGNWDRIREQTSIAQKMSWAARRKTTRIEDQAYCLMGLFKINMPLLYGEGDKAFIRLQEEIIKQTEDLSFLAWSVDRSQSFTRHHFIHWKLPPLADSPSKFFPTRGVRVKKTGELLASNRVFNANTGVYIHRPLLSTLSRRFVFAHLNSEVATRSQRGSKSVWIPLVRDCQTQGFSRSSFPASTVVTNHQPTSCRLYTGTQSEACLRQFPEPVPERYFFRKALVDGDTISSPRRQVGILPVFATPSPMLIIGSYPALDQKDSLILNLAEADEHLYHGSIMFRVPPNQSPGVSATCTAFGIHFLAIFNPKDESGKPLYWYPTAIPTLAGSSPSYLQSRTESMTNTLTKSLFPAAETDSSTTAADSINPSVDFRNIVANDIDSDAFATMDDRWYKFRSAGLEDNRFDTYVNLALFGMK